MFSNGLFYSFDKVIHDITTNGVRLTKPIVDAAVQRMNSHKTQVEDHKEWPSAKQKER